MASGSQFFRRDCVQSIGRGKRMWFTNNAVPTLGVCLQRMMPRAACMRSDMRETYRRLAPFAITSTAPVITASITTADASLPILHFNLSGDSNQFADAMHRNSLPNSRVSQFNQGKACSLSFLETQSKVNDFSNGGEG